MAAGSSKDDLRIRAQRRVSLWNNRELPRDSDAEAAANGQDPAGPSQPHSILRQASGPDHGDKNNGNTTHQPDSNGNRSHATGHVDPSQDNNNNNADNNNFGRPGRRESQSLPSHPDFTERRASITSSTRSPPKDVEPAKKGIQFDTSVDDSTSKKSGSTAPSATSDPWSSNNNKFNRRKSLRANAPTSTATMRTSEDKTDANDHTNDTTSTRTATNDSGSPTKSSKFGGSADTHGNAWSSNAPGSATATKAGGLRRNKQDFPALPGSEPDHHRPSARSKSSDEGSHGGTSTSRHSSSGSHDPTDTSVTSHDPTETSGTSHGTSKTSGTSHGTSHGSSNSSGTSHDPTETSATSHGSSKTSGTSHSTSKTSGTLHGSSYSSGTSHGPTETSGTSHGSSKTSGTSHGPSETSGTSHGSSVSSHETTTSLHSTARTSSGQGSAFSSDESTTATTALSSKGDSGSSGSHGKSSGTSKTSKDSHGPTPKPKAPPSITSSHHDQSSTSGVSSYSTHITGSSSDSPEYPSTLASTSAGTSHGATSSSGSSSYGTSSGSGTSGTWAPSSGTSASHGTAKTSIESGSSFSSYGPSVPSSHDPREGHQPQPHPHHHQIDTTPGRINTSTSVAPDTVNRTVTTVDPAQDVNNNVINPPGNTTNPCVGRTRCFVVESCNFPYDLPVRPKRKRKKVKRPPPTCICCPNPCGGNCCCCCPAPSACPRRQGECGTACHWSRERWSARCPPPRKCPCCNPYPLPNHLMSLTAESNTFMYDNGCGREEFTSTANFCNDRMICIPVPGAGCKSRSGKKCWGSGRGQPKPFWTNQCPLRRQTCCYCNCSCSNPLKPPELYPIIPNYINNIPPPTLSLGALDPEFNKPHYEPPLPAPITPPPNSPPPPPTPPPPTPVILERPPPQKERKPKSQRPPKAQNPPIPDPYSGTRPPPKKGQSPEPEIPPGHTPSSPSVPAKPHQDMPHQDVPESMKPPPPPVSEEPHLHDTPIRNLKFKPDVTRHHYGHHHNPKPLPPPPLNTPPLRPALVTPHSSPYRHHHDEHDPPEHVKVVHEGAPPAGPTPHLPRLHKRSRKPRRPPKHDTALPSISPPESPPKMPSEPHLSPEVPHHHPSKRPSASGVPPETSHHEPPKRDVPEEPPGVTHREPPKRPSAEVPPGVTVREPPKRPSIHEVPPESSHHEPHKRPSASGVPPAPSTAKPSREPTRVKPHSMPPSGVNTPTTPINTPPKRSPVVEQPPNTAVPPQPDPKSAKPPPTSTSTVKQTKTPPKVERSPPPYKEKPPPRPPKSQKPPSAPVEMSPPKVEIPSPFPSFELLQSPPSPPSFDIPSPTFEVPTIRSQMLLKPTFGPPPPPIKWKPSTSPPKLSPPPKIERLPPPPKLEIPKKEKKRPPSPEKSKTTRPPPEEESPAVICPPQPVHPRPCCRPLRPCSRPASYILPPRCCAPTSTLSRLPLYTPSCTSYSTGTILIPGENCCRIPPTPPSRCLTPIDTPWDSRTCCVVSPPCHFRNISPSTCPSRVPSNCSHPGLPLSRSCTHAQTIRMKKVRQAVGETQTPAELFCQRRSPAPDKCRTCPDPALQYLVRSDPPIQYAVRSNPPLQYRVRPNPPLQYRAQPNPELQSYQVGPDPRIHHQTNPRLYQDFVKALSGNVTPTTLSRGPSPRPPKGKPSVRVESNTSNVRSGSILKVSLETFGPPASPSKRGHIEIIQPISATSSIQKISSNIPSSVQYTQTSLRRFPIPQVSSGHVETIPRISSTNMRELPPVSSQGSNFRIPNVYGQPHRTPQLSNVGFLPGRPSSLSASLPGRFKTSSVPMVYGESRGLFPQPRFVQSQQNPYFYRTNYVIPVGELVDFDFDLCPASNYQPTPNSHWKQGLFPGVQLPEFRHSWILEPNGAIRILPPPGPSSFQDYNVFYMDVDPSNDPKNYQQVLDYQDHGTNAGHVPGCGNWHPFHLETIGRKENDETILLYKNNEQKSGTHSRENHHPKYRTPGGNYPQWKPISPQLPGSVTPSDLMASCFHHASKPANGCHPRNVQGLHENLFFGWEGIRDGECGSGGSSAQDCYYTRKNSDQGQHTFRRTLKAKRFFKV